MLLKDPIYKVRKYVNEFFNSDPKKIISDPHEKTMLSKDVYISRKSIKYITHSRQRDHYTKEKILTMIIRTGEVVINPEHRVLNHNKKYPESKISSRYYDIQGVLLVVHMPDGDVERVFNAFYRHPEKYKRMADRS